MTINRYQPWRKAVRIIEAALILGVPFIKIKGESALRFDIPSLRLHFFGFQLWMDEFIVVLTGTIFLTFLFILITQLFGRIWCGWACPQTVINELTYFMDDKRMGPAGKFLSWVAVFAVSALVAANLIWYFVSPYDFFQDLFQWDLGHVVWGFWTILTAILFLNFSLVRYKFCATVCPYARLQGALFDDSTLILAMDAERKDECIDCLACARACPVDIDIRNGLSSACIGCAKCIDACLNVMNKRGKRSLIGYFFGRSGGRVKIMRTNVILTTLVAAVFLILSIYLFHARTDVDLVVLPNNTFTPRVTEKGYTVNSFILSFENRGDDDLEIGINTGDGHAETKITPAVIYGIKAGEKKKFPVYVTIENVNDNRKKKTINILATNNNTGKILIRKTVPIIIPDG